MGFSSKWRLLTVGGLILSALVSAPFHDGLGQSQPLYPAIDGNHLGKGVRHKAYRRKVALQGINLAWAPSPSSPNIDGYRIYYGTSSGNYSEHLDVGMVTSAKVPNATNDASYFYVVVAYKGNLESPPSNEVASAKANPAPTLVVSDTPSSNANPTPRPSPESAATSPTPAPVAISAPESNQPLLANDTASAETPTLRFQRRLQRLRLPQGKDSNQHEGAGAAAAESAPK